MYIFVTSLKQTLKLFISSFIFSALFFKFYDASYSVPLTSFILLLATMLLFAFTCDKLYAKLFNDSEHITEYVVPAAISLGLYVLVAFVIYLLRLHSLYSWMFLPTRFLAPLRPKLSSYILSFFIIFIIIARIPVANYYYMRKFPIETENPDEEKAPVFSPVMDFISQNTYTVGNMFKYAIALLLLSTICSVFFANHLSTMYGKPLVYAVLILVALVVFLMVCKVVFSYLCKQTQSISEHLIPTLFAFAVYVTLSWLLYQHKVSEIYIWVFLPTRFIEPYLKNKPWISYIASYIILFVVLIRIPLEKFLYFRHMEFEERLRETDSVPFESEEQQQQQ